MKISLLWRCPAESYMLPSFRRIMLLHLQGLRFVLRPCRWRQQAPVNLRYFTRRHGVIFWETWLYINTSIPLTAPQISHGQHIAHLQQQCHNSKSVIFQEKLLKVLVSKCYNFLSATTTQLLSSGEFCKLLYDTIPVKSAYANVSIYTNNSKMSQMSDMCRIRWHTMAITEVRQ